MITELDLKVPAADARLFSFLHFYAFAVFACHVLIVPRVRALVSHVVNHFGTVIPVIKLALVDLRGCGPWYKHLPLP